MREAWRIHCAGRTVMAKKWIAPLNLYVDGYERVAEMFKRSLQQNTPKKSLVISSGGRVVYFLRDEPVPANLQPGLIGLFTRDCPIEVIEDALIHHMKTARR